MIDLVCIPEVQLLKVTVTQNLPSSNVLEGRNKHSVRNHLHERGTAGFELLAIGTCSLGVCLGTLLELGGC